ncbi:DotU family type IV/VI secretion system protein [Thalassotalea euphylliae]|uniref:DotU family type IV/VI secretion system protein n=1 Tax=Thalassotalea euphylliae TaxID=1655234 RepID=A0A3E0TQ54_9GAMM|nr:type IVB secretion system protein IcmH/DotU [Thalassotalea euphylliae]REL26628.1 DotU family type IV/VI secretion system protein [Thalassotalea euphylliae]
MEAIDTKQDLLSCIAPVIHALMPLKLHQQSDQISGDFREQIIGCFDQFEKKCYENQITTSQMQEAKFALTATCDELVMSSGADFRLDWMSRPLQLEFYGNNRAGEEFFERMEKLRMGNEDKLKVLEVYYICLQMGFEGAYKVKGLEQLKALIVDIRAQLEDISGIANTTLSDNGKPTEGFVMKVGRNLPYWVIFSIGMSLIMFLFMGFHYVISKEAKASNQVIEKKLEVLKQFSKAEHSGEGE